MVEFEPKLSVIRVREKYSAPYKKHRYLYFLRKEVKSKEAFLKKLKSKVKRWKDGEYYLKLSTGKVFARFRVESGKLTKLYRVSPATEKQYPCWNFFEDEE